MAYGSHLGRDRVVTRIVYASEKAVSCLFTGCTAEFASLAVSDDMIVSDKLKALIVTGVSLEASRVKASTVLVIPTGISAKWGHSLQGAELIYDDQEKLLCLFDGVTMRVTKL